MRQIRESLRLHLQAGLSYNEIGRTLKQSKSVVGKYMSLARVAGVDWAIAQTLSDDELQARLYRPALLRNSKKLVPDFASVRQELKRAGVTLQLLWEEYARSDLGSISLVKSATWRRAFHRNRRNCLRLRYCCCSLLRLCRFLRSHPFPVRLEIDKVAVRTNFIQPVLETRIERRLNLLRLVQLFYGDIGIHQEDVMIFA